MRNLKRVLSLVLAAMMLIGMMVIGASAAGGTKAADYSNAIEMLTNMGVVEGYPDGSYHQNDTVTRAQMAAIIYRVMTGDNKGNSDDAAATNYGNFAVTKFSDVKSTNWAVGYIGYCANAGIIEGYPDGTFQPNKQITIYEVMAMLLRAVGYGKNNEYVGAEWTKYVLVDANQTNIYSGVVKAPDAAADRGVVAQLTYNAATGTARVTYTPALGYVRLSSLGTAYVGGVTLIDLDRVGYGYDVWGNPSDEYEYTFTIPGKDGDFAITAEPDLVYTTAVDDCDIIEDLGFKTDAKAAIVVDGRVVVGSVAKNEIVAPDNANIKATTTTIANSANLSGTGVLTKVYVTGKDTILITEVNTYFAEVTKVTKEVLDKNDHVKTPASVDIDVYTQNNGKASAITGIKTTDYAVGDYVLITKLDINANVPGIKATAKGTVQTHAAATPVATGKVSAYAVSKETNIRINGSVTIGGVKYAENVKFFYVSNNSSDNTPEKGRTYEVYTDAYGNVIALVEPAPSAKTYAILDIGYDFSTGRNSKYDADVVDYDGEVHIWDIASYNYDSKTKTSENESWDDRGTAVHHIVSYTENKDGTYDLVAMTAGTKLGENYILDTKDGSTASITKGNVNIKVDGKTVAIADNSTTYVVENSKHQFTSYVGYKNMISLTNITGLEVLVGSNGKADLVYIYGGETEAEYTTTLAWALGGMGNANLPKANPNVVGKTENGIDWTQWDNFVIDGKFTSLAVADNVDGLDKITSYGLYKLTIDESDPDQAVVVKIEKLKVESGKAYHQEGASRVVEIGGDGYVIADDAVILLLDTTQGYVAKGDVADLDANGDAGIDVWYTLDKAGNIDFIAIRADGTLSD